MNQITSCQSKAISLNQILTSSSIQLPVYTRFQKTDLYLTLPVTSVEVSDSGITVQTSNDAPSQIAWDELLDIVTFVDGNGKPVFLTELSNGGDVAAIIRAESEEKTNEQRMYRLKHQHEYVSMEDDREVWWRPWEVATNVYERAIELAHTDEDENASWSWSEFSREAKKKSVHKATGVVRSSRAPIRSHKSNLIYRQQ